MSAPKQRPFGDEVSYAKINEPPPAQSRSQRAYAWATSMPGIVIISAIVVILFAAASMIEAAAIFNHKTAGEFSCNPPAYMNQQYTIKDAVVNASQLMALTAAAMEYDFALSGTRIGACRLYCERKFNMREFACRDAFCQVCEVPGAAAAYDAKRVSASPYTACIRACASCAQGKCLDGTAPFARDGACGFDCQMFGYKKIKCV